MQKESHFLQTTIREIGAMQMDMLAGGFSTTEKSDALDLVTELDVYGEQYFTEQVHTIFPGDVILGEETHDPSIDYQNIERLWVIDPVDGTLFLNRGYDHWGISIALMVEGEIHLGAIYYPQRDELYFADEHGATKNGKAIYVSSVETCEAGVHDWNLKSLIDHIDNPLDVMKSVGRVVDFGHALPKLTNVAEGKTESGLFIWKVKAWDMAAGGFIIQKAGGRITEVDGSPWTPFSETHLFSNGGVHDELIEILQHDYE